MFAAGPSSHRTQNLTPRQKAFPKDRIGDPRRQHRHFRRCKRTLLIGFAHPGLRVERPGEHKPELPGHRRLFHVFGGVKAPTAHGLRFFRAAEQQAGFGEDPFGSAEQLSLICRSEVVRLVGEYP